MSPTSQNVQVAIRVRNPPTWLGRDPNSEKNTPEYNAPCVYSSNKNPATGLATKVVMKHPETPEPREFAFDTVFDGLDTQESVYDKLVSPIIEKCLSGYNGCIFAYGQTASGKTFTMGGPAVPKPEDRGIIPRVAAHIVK